MSGSCGCDWKYRMERQDSTGFDRNCLCKVDRSKLYAVNVREKEKQVFTTSLSMPTLEQIVLVSSSIRDHGHTMVLQLEIPSP